MSSWCTPAGSHSAPEAGRCPGPRTERHVERHACLDDLVVRSVQRLGVVTQLQPDGGAHTLGHALHQRLLAIVL